MDEVEQLLLFDGANGTNATAAIWEPVVDINGTAAFNGSTAEEAHFLVALSLYGLACLLLAAIYATRGRPGGAPPFATPSPRLEAVMGHLQALDATPRRFERAEDMELPSPSEAPGGACARCAGLLKALAFVGALVLCVLLLPLQDWLLAVFGFIQGAGPLGCLLLVSLYVPFALTGCAISLLHLAAGALYGPVDGVILAVVGYNCGGMAGFLAGRYLVRRCVLDWIRTRRMAVLALKVLSRKGPLLILICRACPFLPYSACNYVFGLSDIGSLSFTLASFVAATPTVFIYVAIGSTVDDVAQVGHLRMPHWMLWVLAAAAVLLAVTVCWVMRVGKRMLREEEEERTAREQVRNATTIPPIDSEHCQNTQPSSTCTARPLPGLFLQRAFLTQRAGAVPAGAVKTRHPRPASDRRPGPGRGRAVGA
eukprot:COSAG04_NODE_883_length_9658_cov_5.510409_4_plen_425_part_00